MSRSGHGAPIFISGLHVQLQDCEHAGVLRHVHSFPVLGLLRPLRPTPAASADNERSLRPAGSWPGWGPPGWFPRSLRTVRQGWCPAMPLRHRHGYAADIHRGLRTDDQNRWRSSPPHTWWVRATDQPRSVRFELEGGLRSFQTLVSHVHRPVLLAGPKPSDSAGLSRRCRGCLPPNKPVPACQAAPSFSCSLRRAESGVLSPPHGSTAPRGAPGLPPSGRPRDGHRLHSAGSRAESWATRTGHCAGHDDGGGD